LGDEGRAGFAGGLRLRMGLGMVLLFWLGRNRKVEKSNVVYVDLGGEGGQAAVRFINKSPDRS
jgi:hypothetical protein